MLKIYLQFLDGCTLQASFIHLGQTNDSLSPKTPYCCKLTQHSKGSALEFGVWSDGKTQEEGAETWLRTKLFPRLVKWIVLEHNPSSTIPDSSLCLVDLNDYNEKYQQLKTKYGAEMVKVSIEIFLYECLRHYCTVLPSPPHI